MTPPGISIGIREMIPTRKLSTQDIDFYQKLEASGTKVQHICYEPEDVDLLAKLLTKSQISKDGVWCMFVIGHYSGKISDPKNYQSLQLIKNLNQV